MTTNWPWPGDAPVVRARKCAWAFRAALAEADPGAVAELDRRLAVAWGERWLTGHVNYAAEDWVTAKEAADILGISSGSISKLRLAGRLPAKLEGKRQFKYRVADVWKLADQVRPRKRVSTVRMSDDGIAAPIGVDNSRTSPNVAETARGTCGHLHPGISCDQFHDELRQAADA